MKKILFTAIFLLGLTSAFGAAPALYPGVSEVRLTEGRGQGSFLMFNTGDEIKKYKITVRDVDNLGDESLLAEHLKVFPTYVEIEPGKNKKIRYLIRNFPQDSVTEGEHRASIAIEELESTLEQKHQVKEDQEGITTVINYKYHINMALYGYVGELISKAEVKLDEIDDNTLRGSIKNIGNYSYPIACTFLDKSGAIIQEKSLPKLMDGETQDLTLQVPQGAAKVQISGGKENTLLYENKISL